MKAFRITLPDYFPDMIAIYADKSASKARYQAYVGMRDANYNNVKFGDIHVIRSPQHDFLAENCEEPKSLGWHDRTFYYGCFDRERITR